MPIGRSKAMGVILYKSLRISQVEIGYVIGMRDGIDEEVTDDSGSIVFSSLRGYHFKLFNKVSIRNRAIELFKPFSHIVFIYIAVFE